MRPIVNMPEEDRATAIGNMRKNLLKMARGLPEISCRTDRETDRQTDRQTHSSQYFPTAPAGAVKDQDAQKKRSGHKGYRDVDPLTEWFSAPRNLFVIALEYRSPVKFLIVWLESYMSNNVWDNVRWDFALFVIKLCHVDRLSRALYGTCHLYNADISTRLDNDRNYFS